MVVFLLVLGAAGKINVDCRKYSAISVIVVEEFDRQFFCSFKQIATYGGSGYGRRRDNPIPLLL